MHPRGGRERNGRCSPKWREFRRGNLITLGALSKGEEGEGGVKTRPSTADG